MSMHAGPAPALGYLGYLVRACLALSLLLASGPAKALNCAVFPPDDPWNQRVDSLPVHPRSADYVASMGAGLYLHADFGSYAGYGISYNVVGKNTPRVQVKFVEYGAESDRVPYPIPAKPKIEGGSDKHVLLVDDQACKLYELYHAKKTKKGWQAGSGAVFDLLANTYRPAGWTSADAAGLPIFPGLVRFEEVAQGVIRHALRFTAVRTQRAYIHPARHWASSSTDPTLPPMGLRVRMKAGYDTSWISGQARVIVEALKLYGLILADNGTSWFITGTSHPNFDDEDLDQLKRVPAAAFEAVDTGPLVTP
jgi:hypothetical protein